MIRCSYEPPSTWLSIQANSWSLTIDDGDGSGSFLINPGNSGLVLFGSGVTADIDSIDFDFSGSGVALDFQNPSPGSGINFWCMDSIGISCTGSNSTESVNRFGTETIQGRSGVISIATRADDTVPEPASLLLAGLALASVAGLRRRS